MALTLVATVDTGWVASSAGFKSVPALNVLAGDLIIACSSYSGSGRTLSMSGGGLWDNWLVEIGSSDTMSIDSFSVPSPNAAQVYRINRTGSAISINYGAILYQFRDTVDPGVGIVEGTHGTGLPQFTMSSLVQANSSIVVFSTDASPLSSSLTWLTDAGSFTEKLNNQFDSNSLIHSGYHPDAGPASSYLVGESSPGGQTYIIGAIEVTGSAAAPPPLIPVGWFTA